MAKSTVTLGQAPALSQPQKLADEQGKALPPEPIPEVAKAKQIRVRNATPKLKFRYLKNRMITLRDIDTPIIPSRAVNAFTTHGQSIVHEFDLSTIHTVSLRDENPKVLTQLPNMSKSHHERLITQAEQTAVANRLWNDMIRYELSHYVEDGTLEIVEDPFDGREVTESDYEGAVSLHRSHQNS